MRKVRESATAYEVQEKANLTLSLPIDLLRRLKELAGKRGQSVNAVVRELVEEEVGRSPNARSLSDLLDRFQPNPQADSKQISREELYEGARFGDPR